MNELLSGIKVMPSQRIKLAISPQVRVADLFLKKVTFWKKTAVIVHKSDDLFSSFAIHHLYVQCELHVDSALLLSICSVLDHR